MTTTTTTGTEYVFSEKRSSFIPDGWRNVLKASTWAHKGQLRLLIDLGHIEDGETPEQLFAGELISTPDHVELPAEDALGLAAYLVSNALPHDRAERMDALAKFTESVL